MQLDTSLRYHFVGIGGIGMSAIAQVLMARGFRVSGSDARHSPMLDRLAGLGAEVWAEHDAAHVQPGDVVVLSDAIKANNPERRAAEALGLSTVMRADVLAALANGARGLAVAGTHGKTTTSGMLALILMEAGYDPTCVLGGEMAPLGGSNARVGGSLTVVEACEAYNSFIQLTPEAAVVTNIEVDHLDFHGTPEHLFDSFARFLGQVRDLAVVNGDDARLRGLADRAPRVVTYGADAGNTYRFAEVALGAEPSFALWRGNARLGTVRLRVPGLHNISNAVGAAALALELGAPMDAVTRALGAFPGMRRRFERLGTCGGVAVVDDYAHHPTEIRATLEAARAAFPGRVVAVFQPHLFSRTRDLLDDFAGALALADVALVLPIYAAREAPIAGVDHAQLVARIRALAPDRTVAGLGGHEEAVALLAHAAGRGVAPAHAHAMRPLSEGDVIFTIGAGDVDRVGHALVAGDFFDGTPST